MFYGDYSVQQRVSECLYAVYGLMAFAQVLTAGMAYYVASTPAIYEPLFSSSWLLIGLFIAQLALVMVLSFFLLRISQTTAFILFILYALTVGVTLSSIFLVFTTASIYKTFLVTAGMFGSMCLYGYFTKTDLTRIGNLAMMALFGLIIAFLVNYFFKSESFDLVLSGIGVLIFTLLTAYDSQRIKQMAYQMIGNDELMGKVAIIGALTLYLDFINIFLFLLRFMGNRRD